MSSITRWPGFHCQWQLASQLLASPPLRPLSVRASSGLGVLVDRTCFWRLPVEHARQRGVEVLHMSTPAWCVHHGATVPGQRQGPTPEPRSGVCRVGAAGSDGMQRTPTEGPGGSAVETEAGLRMIAHLHESHRLGESPNRNRPCHHWQRAAARFSLKDAIKNRAVATKPTGFVRAS